MSARSRGFAALAAAGAAALTLSLAGCAAAAPPSDGVQIVVTTNILGDVTSEIVGDVAQVTTLMKPNADPHSFEISAQQAAAMDRADLLVSNGLGLEEGLQQHLDRVIAAGGTQFVAGDHVDVLSYAHDSADARSADGPRDGAAHTGDAATPDPHFWTDPTQMVSVARALTDAITALPGMTADARDQIEARASAYIAELTALDATIAERFAGIPAEHRALVTNHHVFGYLAKRYDFRVLGTAIPGGTTLAAPSAADLSALVTTITAAGVPTIFAETSAPDRLMRVLAEEAGIDVQVVALFTESLTADGGGAASYTEMLQANTERIVAGLTPELGSGHESSTRTPGTGG